MIISKLRVFSFREDCYEALVDECGKSKVNHATGFVTRRDGTVELWVHIGGMGDVAPAVLGRDYESVEFVDDHVHADVRQYVLSRVRAKAA